VQSRPLDYARGVAILGMCLGAGWGPFLDPGGAAGGLKGDLEKGLKGDLEKQAQSAPAFQLIWEHDTGMAHRLP
jgi:hypothetical protein